MRIRIFGGLMWLLLVFGVVVYAQDTPIPQAWEVYLEQDIDTNGTDRLTFIDLADGTTRTAQVYGERFTPLGDYLLFYDNVNQAVMTVRPDGTVSPHPFIQLDADAKRVDWIVSRENRLIAWTLTYQNESGLRTVTQVSSPDGALRRVVLENGFRNDGVRALPVAFTVDNRALIMDAQPDGIGRFAPYTQYAALFRVLIDEASLALPPEERTELLPGEPSCFCGPGVRAGLFIRLALTADLRGFDVHVYNLEGDNPQIIPAADFTGYTMAGDVLISPDGRRAVYALSAIENFGADNQSVRTVFMMINLETMMQAPLTDPITTYVHPLRWTEDDSAVLFTSPQTAGTWKIRLADGVLQRVVNATYIGVLEG